MNTITFLKKWGAVILCALCGLTAFFMIFANAVIFTETAHITHSFTGVQAALGFALNDVEMIHTSAGIILSYAFPLFAVCVLVFGSFSEKYRKIVYACVSAILLVGGVLAFCSVKLLNGSYFGTPSLGGGAIASGVLSLLGSLSACAAVFLKA